MTTLTLVAEDFGTPGSLPTPPWTVVLGSAWTSDGFVARPARNAGEQDSTMVAAFTPTIPYQLRYEVDVFWPATLGTTCWLGLTALKSSIAGRTGIYFQLRRTSGGASNTLNLGIAATAAAGDYALASASYTATAGARYRLRLDVTFGTSSFNLSGWLYDVTGALVTFVLAGGVTTALFDSVTGRTTPDGLLVTKQIGISGTVAGPADGYVDRVRIIDISPGIPQTAPIHSPYTLTPDPALTYLTPSSEDDSTGDTLPIAPNFPEETDSLWNPRVSRWDGGYTQTQATQSGERWVRPATFGPMSATDYATLASFHATVYGIKKAFDWTHPSTGEVLTMRFLTDLNVRKLGKTVAGDLIYEASADMEVVRG